MINYIRRHLGVKLFLTYVFVLLAGMFILVGSTQFSLPNAFRRHLAGMRMGMQGPVMTQEFFGSFRAGFNDALFWAVLVAILLALLVSILLSRSVIAPVRAMTSASQRIAEGHYNERVSASGADELGQLAGSFNRMAERLEETETMRRQLIGDVTHELRTPLTTIKGSMEGLMDGILPPTPETFEQIYKEADRLNHLVDDLQELSRVEAGAYELDLQPVSVSELVSITLKRLRRQFDEKGISVNTEIPPDLPLVMVDVDRIGQVLVNLIGNALHYTPEGGTVWITASRVANNLQVSVRDTGIGIPAKHLPRIFDRFYRVDKSRSRRIGGGSGIGLTIARHLVEAHKGKIWAESDGEGKGSTFTFSLPVAA